MKEKNIEELLVDSTIAHILDDPFTMELLNSLKDKYTFFSKDRYIYFAKREMIDSKKQIEEIFKKEIISDDKFSLRNNFKFFRIYKKETSGFGETKENINIAISLHNFELLKSTNNTFYWSEISTYGKFTHSLFYLNGNHISKFFKNKCFTLNTFKTLSKEDLDTQEMLIHILKLKNPNWYLWDDLKISDLSSLFSDFEVVFNCNTKQQLIEQMFSKKIKFNLNKLDLKIGISLAYYIEFVHEKDHQKLYDLCLKLTLNQCSIPSDDDLNEIYRFKRRKFEVLNIIFIFFLEKKHARINNRHSANYVKDYIRMCLLEKQFLNLKIASFNKIEEKHNELMLLQQMKKYKVRLKIHKIYSEMKLSKEFTLLKTTKQITEEGISQNHCIASYIPEVNNGKCIIYSTVHKEIKYTFDIKYSEKKKFYLGEIQGYGNKAIVPNELKTKIQNQIKENNLNFKKVT